MPSKRSKPPTKRRVKSADLSSAGEPSSDVLDSSESIKKHIQALDPPSEIKSVEVSFGVDSGGDPTIWIDFFVADDSDISVAIATRFANRVQRDILSANHPQAWPHVRLRSA